jgi:hypothetical protein
MTPNFSRLNASIDEYSAFTRECTHEAYINLRDRRAGWFPVKVEKTGDDVVQVRRHPRAVLVCLSPERVRVLANREQVPS